MSEHNPEQIFMALADFLIPAHNNMPVFSGICTYADALKALDFRDDLKDGFARALTGAIDDGPEAYLEALNIQDSDAFSAVTTIIIATYYMNTTVRECIGYPGQENVPYLPYATQTYLTDGSLGKVIARGRKYRPTPGL